MNSQVSGDLQRRFITPGRGPSDIDLFDPKPKFDNPGVRFIPIHDRDCDHHADIPNSMKQQCPQTDELGCNIVENPVPIHDFQATILHLLGLNHEKLTYRFQGRDFRLTDIGGKVVPARLASTCDGDPGESAGISRRVFGVEYRSAREASRRERKEYEDGEFP